MSGPTAGSDSEPVTSGHFAQREVHWAGAAPSAGEQQLELVLPFGELFSALFPARSFVVRSLSIDYVAPVRGDGAATFSVKVGELAEAGEAVQLSLLVFRESKVCMRGAARLEFAK